MVLPAFGQCADSGSFPSVREAISAAIRLPQASARMIRLSTHLHEEALDDTRTQVLFRWRLGRSRAAGRLDVINPATERAHASIPMGSAVDVERAIAAGCAMVLKPSEIAPMSGLLWAYIQSTDLGQARAVAREMRAGTVNLNGPDSDTFAPFGGYKQSGNGREYAHWGMMEFLETKGIFGYGAA